MALGGWDFGLRRSAPSAEFYHVEFYKGQGLRAFGFKFPFRVLGRQVSVSVKRRGRSKGLRLRLRFNLSLQAFNEASVTVDHSAV